MMEMRYSFGIGWVQGGGGETIFAEQTLSSAQLLLNHMMIHMTNNDMNRWW